MTTGLMKKFTKEPKYQEEYRKAVSKYLNDGYAERITQKEELDHPIQWFFPHQGVYKKSAKEKTLRIVFDATAEFEEKSLNNSMLTGPKLQSELPEILLKFRERSITLGAQMETMFSRIRLTKADARYHRFLMTEPTTGEVEVYQMNRLKATLALCTGQLKTTEAAEKELVEPSRRTFTWMIIWIASILLKKLSGWEDV